MSEGKGQCLCGAVKFRAKNMSNQVGVCHCGMCRTWGGGPLMAVGCGSDVEFDGEENITVYDSSEWAERGFCKICGSHLFYRLKETRDHEIPAGLFADQSRLVFELQVFTDYKPAYYSFANQTEEMTEAEVIAKYAPDQAT